MNIRVDFEGNQWASGNHKWEPIYPVESTVKCVHCGRIESKEVVRRGGLNKCEWEIK